MMKTRQSGERGQMLVMLTLVLPIVLGFVALTIDVGLAFVERRNLQNAVDAAAQDLANGASEATVTATAMEYLQRNGFTTRMT